ncbi:MAG: beta-propeller fold lactonase family protein [Caldilineaceae bacterium]|nr:beta-propeller fold lactonase family protein [Caldilineaceae bacterium]
MDRAGEPSAGTEGAIYLPLVSQPPSASPAYAAWSSPIAINPVDNSVWVVNPDAGTISVMSDSAAGGDSFQKQGEFEIGGEPWSIAIAHDGGSIFVADRAQGRVLVLDAASSTVVGSLVVGSEPGGVVLSADGNHLFVSLMAEAAVVAVDTASLQIVERIDVSATPYALAITAATAQGDDERLLVTHLFGFPIPDTIEAENDSRQGRVTLIDTALLQVVGELIVPPNEHGLPSLMASIAVQGGRAWLPHVRASPALPNGMTTTTFAAVATLDLARKAELPSTALHLNDQQVFGSPVNNPAAAAPSPDGRMLYLVHGGSDQLEVVNISTPDQPRLVKFLATGKNPRGIVLSADGKHAYVMNYLSRTVSLYDMEQLALLAEIEVTAETLPSDVLAGKILFHNATNPRLSRGGWTSCASCHFDGWPDGITWLFPDGPRQSPMFWNAADTLPWHWSATLDEAQDVEETIHEIQSGLGLIPGEGPTLLGAPLAGRNADLDALSAFLLRGMRPVHIVAPADNTTDNRVDLAAGRALFTAQSCNSCHGGSAWTISALPGEPGTLDPDGDGMINSVLRDVGTYGERDVRGKGGFDVPSLLGVGLTAPYFHDGSALTLEDLLRSGHPLLQTERPPLSNAELADLVAFLRSIGPDTLPIAIQPIPTD